MGEAGGGERYLLHEHDEERRLCGAAIAGGFEELSLEIFPRAQLLFNEQRLVDVINIPRGYHLVVVVYVCHDV